MKEAQYNIKIIYPDHENVDYHFDPAGQLQSITTNLGNFIGAGANSTIVERILYNGLGERTSIKYGNGTVTNYIYDARRRMNLLKHTFTGFQAERNYKYDMLSNILNISTTSTTSPSLGQLGGPVQHKYTYDNYNRLMRASGYYVGPDDAAPNMLKQAYSLDMTYDDAHNILEKHQVHQFGSVTAIGQNLPQNALHAPLTSYKLEYGGYATGVHTADGNGYVQPHAPRTIIEYPNENFNGDPEDPRIRHKMIDYDANGNQLEIRERITDPAEPQGFREVPLKKHLWDEEDRLRAVDLSPENDEDKPLVAVYTYDASGERSIKYVPGRLDARYSAKEIGKVDRLESMLYPNPLLSAKSLPIPEMRRDVKDPKLISYTKHYYASTPLSTGIGSERIASVIGSKLGLGAYPGLSETTVPLNLVEDIVDAAGTAVQGAVAHFGKTIILPQPYRFSDGTYNGSDIQDPENYAAFWYHPDHLGSSSYITNLLGEITQHMEYLPFGETLIEEHLNSNNSPYKFNAKEMDAETGNYYYGARYYDPKWSIWLSVDPLAEQTFESYLYVGNNPINFIDPTGMSRESTHTDVDGNVIAVYDDGDLGVYGHKNGTTTADIDAAHSKDNTSAGGTKKGETLHTFSFVDGSELEKGNIVPTGKIDFSSTWAQDKVQSVLDDSYGIGHYGINARSGGDLDIKLDAVKEGLAGGIYNGSQIAKGVYASARDAGNFAAGAKADNSMFSNRGLMYGYGAYNAGNNTVKGALFSIGSDFMIRLSGGNKGLLQSPNYGEDRQSALGIQAGMRNSNWFD